MTQLSLVKPLQIDNPKGPYRKIPVKYTPLKFAIASKLNC